MLALAVHLAANAMVPNFDSRFYWALALLPSTLICAGYLVSFLQYLQAGLWGIMQVLRSVSFQFVVLVMWMVAGAAVVAPVALFVALGAALLLLLQATWAWGGQVGMKRKQSTNQRLPTRGGAVARWLQCLLFASPDNGNMPQHPRRAPPLLPQSERTRRIHDHVHTRQHQKRRLQQGKAGASSTPSIRYRGHKRG